MSKIPPLLLTPDDLREPSRALSWLEAIADKMLNAMTLEVNGAPHRLVEIELDLHHAAHPDPFTPRERRLRSCGQWSMRRLDDPRGGGGLDMSFGGDNTYGGALIRSIETPEGRVISGPHLCVNHILRSLRLRSAEELALRFADLPAWHPRQPARLRPTELPRRQIFESARVGLSLTDARRAPQMTEFILRPYRFLTDPKQLRDGHPHLALAMHLRGATVAEISRLTRQHRDLLRAWIEHLEYGRRDRDLSRYVGQAIDDDDTLCQLHGAWSRQQSERSSS